MKYACFLTAMIALLTGCSSVVVSNDYNSETDFSTLSTFAWQHEKQPKTGNPRVDNDLFDIRVRQAVDAALAAKGFKEVEKSDADFLVAYYMQYKRRISGDTWVFGTGFGWYDGYGSLGYNTTITDYDEGRLTIDIRSPLEQKTIWRGVGVSSTFDGATPEKMTRIINSAVTKILAGFPPQKK